jgi:hypothetical protein
MPPHDGQSAWFRRLASSHNFDPLLLSPEEPLQPSCQVDPTFIAQLQQTRLKQELLRLFFLSNAIDNLLQNPQSLFTWLRFIIDSFLP